MRKFSRKVCEKCPHAEFNISNLRCHLLRENIDDDGVMQQRLAYQLKRVEGRTIVDILNEEQFMRCPYHLEHILTSQQPEIPQ
jgi:hypothetical protein